MHDRQDTDHAVSLLAVLVSKLETAPPSDALRALIRDCADAMEELIEVRRDPRAELPTPTASELAWLVRLLPLVDRSESVSITRQIRQVLGRLDMSLR